MTNKAANTSNIKTPMIGFIARSGTGKTTLLKKIITAFKNRNINVAAIKHSHHDFEIDKPGKDSYELRSSGATQTIIVSPQRLAMIEEYKTPRQDAHFNDCLKTINHNVIDLILVEGFKHENFPKLEIYRSDSSSTEKDYFYPTDKNIMALVSDTTPEPQCPLPVLNINDPEQIVDFIIDNIVNVNSSQLFR